VLERCPLNIAGRGALHNVISLRDSSSPALQAAGYVAPQKARIF